MARNMDNLTTAIAEMVVCDGLSFNFAEKIRFMNVLKAAKKVNLDKYSPPNRHSIGGHLLDINFQTVMDTNRSNLLLEAGTYGIAFVGDGATVKKLPLANMLSMGIHCPPAVLEICDCTGHMERGGIKDARYIAGRFIPVIKSLDPRGNLTDVVFFDGASNVQLAGQILAEHFPRMTCLKGVEHCVALLFSDLAKIDVVKDTILRQNRMYLVFSSGIFHASHAIFRGQSKSFNNGREIGLLRATPVRMAGYFYAMMRALRCRDSLRATVTHSEWAKRSKKKKEARAGSDVMDDTLWKRMYVLCKVVLPALLLLRLADRNSPGMDMLKYYVDEFLRSLAAHQPLLDDQELFPMEDFIMDSQLQLDQEYSGEEVPSKGKKSEEDPIPDDLASKKDKADSSGTTKIPKIKSLHKSWKTFFQDEDEDSDDDDYEQSDSGDSDSESSVEKPQGFASSNFSGKMLHLWQKREDDVVSDFALAGWMCCVLPSVRRDVREFMCIDNACDENKSPMVSLYRERVSNLVRRLFSHLTLPHKVARMVDSFWTDWKAFHLKLKPYDDNGIWDVGTVAEGKSHEWHDIHSLHKTESFGFVACRTTSKALGIGSAERSWGDVKTLREGKRCNIGSGRLEKQAVCYTHSCLERARIFREGKSEHKVDPREVEHGWEDMDRKFELQIDGWLRNDDTDPIDLPKAQLPPTRVVKCWVEEWEEEQVMARGNQLMEARFSAKYTGLHFFDPDKEELHVIQDHMRYINRQGWHVTSVIKGNKVTDVNLFDPWAIIEKFDKKTKVQTQFPIVQLIKETQQPKHLNIKMFNSEEEFDAYDLQVKESDEQTSTGIYRGIEEGDDESMC
jgi:hypothetical protein